MTAVGFQNANTVWDTVVGSITDGSMSDGTPGRWFGASGRLEGRATKLKGCTVESYHET